MVYGLGSGVQGLGFRVARRRDEEAVERVWGLGVWVLVLCGAEKTKLLTRIKPVNNVIKVIRKLPTKSKRIDSVVVLNKVSRKMP